MCIICHIHKHSSANELFSLPTRYLNTLYYLIVACTCVLRVSGRHTIPDIRSRVSLQLPTSPTVQGRQAYVHSLLQVLCGRAACSIIHILRDITTIRD